MTAVAAVGMMVLTMCLHAQQPLEIGPAIGYEFGAPLGINRTPGAINDHSGFDGRGTSSNHLLRFGGDLLMRDLFTSNLGLRAYLGLATSWGTFTSLPYDGDVLVDNTTGMLYTSRRRFSVDVNESLVRLGLGLPLSFGAASVELGVWSSLQVASSVVLNEESLDTITTSDANRSISVDGALAGDALHYGASLTGAIRIPLSPGVTLQPSLNVQADLPALLRDAQGVRALSIGGGASILFDLGTIRAAHLEPPPPVTVLDTTPRKPASRLTASVQLYSSSDGLRDSGAVVVHAEDVVHRLRMPLLPVIYFGDEATTLPARYRRLRPAEAATFSPASLGGMEPADVYYAALDIIGWRLRRDPSARITLIGSASADEPQKHALSRARSVAAYLRDVWKIEEGRMKLETRRGEKRSGASERVVHLSASTTSITAPVATQWIVRSLVAPTIGATPAIVADAGVAAWTITISQNGRQVARYGSSDTGRPAFTGMILPAAADAGVPPPLVAALQVTDSTGTTVTVHDTLDVRLERSPLQGARTASRERLRVLFLNEDDDLSTPDANRMLLQSLAAYVREGARVTILPMGQGGRLEQQDSAAIVARSLFAELGTRGVRLAELRVDADGESNPTLVSDASVEALFATATVVVVEQEGSGVQMRGE